jgi:hypothetical protein
MTVMPPMMPPMKPPIIYDPPPVPGPPGGLEPPTLAYLRGPGNLYVRSMWDGITTVYAQGFDIEGAAWRGSFLNWDTFTDYFEPISPTFVSVSKQRADELYGADEPAE